MIKKNIKENIKKLEEEIIEIRLKSPRSSRARALERRVSNLKKLLEENVILLCDGRVYCDDTIYNPFNVDTEPSLSLAGADGICYPGKDNDLYHHFVKNGDCVVNINYTTNISRTISSVRVFDSKTKETKTLSKEEISSLDISSLMKF